MEVIRFEISHLAIGADQYPVTFKKDGNSVTFWNQKQFDEIGACDGIPLLCEFAPSTKIPSQYALASTYQPSPYSSSDYMVLSTHGASSTHLSSSDWCGEELYTTSQSASEIEDAKTFSFSPYYDPKLQFHPS